MKKKILFVSPHMILGGLEKSLLSLLSSLPEDKFEITVLLVKKRGALLANIPNNIRVLEIPLPNDVGDELLAGGAKASTIRKLKKFQFIGAIKIVLKKVLKLDPIPELSMNYNDIPILDEKFDVAVAYQLHMPFIVKYVTKNIRAKKKILWIHSDLTKSGFNPRILKKELNKFDEFITVSKKLRDEFISYFPLYEDKTDVIYNILPIQYIHEMSDEEVDFDNEYKGLKILTIGRLAREKGIDIAIESFKHIRSEGYNCKWYVIGDGVEKSNIRKKIKANNLENHFIILGSKINPYPYLKECDIYVQPSRTEGYCITLSEAKTFSRPIVTTNFAGAFEQIENERTGLITEVDPIKLYESIKKLIEDGKLRNNFSIELMDANKTDIPDDGIDKIIAKFDI